MLAILKFIGRGTKLVGAAVGVGGFAASMLDPTTAVYIVGASMIAGEAVMIVGDIMDDGKLNKSFTTE